MRNITLLSLAAAAVLFTGCGEDTKKAVADATAKATETVKESTQNAVEATKEAASSAVEATKEAAANAVDATKEAAANAADAAAQKATEAKAAAEEKAAAAAEALKERAAAATEAAKEKAADAVKATKEAVSGATEANETTAAAAPAASTGSDDLAAKGKELFAKCAGCHGADGKTKALGKSEIIAGQPAADLEKKIGEYKAGTRNVAGMGTLMKGQVGSLSDDDIKAVAAYISSLK